jgi:dolichol-phosphate mannosyltransferase
MPEHHRYIRGLRSWVGYRQIGISIERAQRHSGRTKYGPMRLLGLAFDGISAFSIVPLRAATVLGFAHMGLAGLFAVYSLFAKFFLTQSPRGFTALTILIIFLAGFNLLFLGVIGEYVGRIYLEVTLQRYLMEHLTKASFPVREIGTVLTLLHARYELEDLIRLDNFQG